MQQEGLGVKQRRITIADVADALGVTKGTVSRALNGYSDIADSTRLRIQRKAQELGYRPLSHAQAIRTGKVRSIGLVLQINAHDAQRPFLADFLAGVTKGASDEHWTLTVSTAASDADMRDTLTRLVEERKADGFILPRALRRDYRVELLRRLEVPFVLYGRTPDMAGCPFYDIRGEEAMEEAVLRLAAFGHRRIGFINGGLEYYYSALRLEGYKAGLAKAGIAYRPEYVQEDAVTVAQGHAAGERLLGQAEPPTAVVCAVDMAALGLYQAIRAAGQEPGRDVSVIAYDGVPEGAYAQPPLTTFAVDSRRAGERLARLLITRIRGGHPDTLREFDRAQLVVRGSDGPPPRPDFTN
ncbi:HTH-type transcriptional repressor CytR [Pseudoruegeria aquimaris]|uniref:HTH-type transcriptional repressor CytR n=1 Tax=Pseudoruegeria aquimaris TaxID=393663 RepID=A0A1Y5RER4_9RHOB|nr:substrate-binding domain-containing protein [Pseudoruegeria aquimaris]SLN14574.1 HTH-type transcriptional repressor CytR [Pseudoruegeria aquimaris]